MGRARTGGGGRMPRAPSPALSLPGMLMRSKNGRSAGLDGTGLSFPSHSTNRGAFGSPNTRSSFSPLSTCARASNPFSLSHLHISPRRRRIWGPKRGAYGHGEHGVGGLEAVRPLLPEVPFLGALDGGDVATGAGAGLRDEHVANAVLRGQSLRGAEAADAAAHHDAVRGHPRAGGCRRLGRATGHRGAAHADAATAKPRGTAGPVEWRQASGRGGGHGGGDHFSRRYGARVRRSG